MTSEHEVPIYGEIEEEEEPDNDDDEQQQQNTSNLQANNDDNDGAPIFDDNDNTYFTSQKSQNQHPDDNNMTTGLQEFDDLFGGDEDDDDEMRENVDSLAGTDSEEEEERIRNLVIKKKAGASTLKRRKDKGSSDKSKKKRKRGNDESEEGGAPLTEQELREKEFDDVFNAVLDKIKPKRAKKKNKDGEDSTETTYDDVAARLREKMRNSAQKDAQLHENKQIALEKDKLFETVRKAMQRKHLYDVYIDNEILGVIKEWLEPLRPDGLLPSLNIQRILLDGLAQMPITPDHLRSSGVGRVIKFYANPLTRNVSEEMKRKAQILLDRWTNLVLGRSMNFRDSRIEYRPVTQSQITSPQKPVFSTAQSNDDTVYARRPTAGLPAFQYMPQSQPTNSQARKEMPEHLSKLSKKLNNIGRTKGGPSKPKKT